LPEWPDSFSHTRATSMPWINRTACRPLCSLVQRELCQNINEFHRQPTKSSYISAYLCSRSGRPDRCFARMRLSRYLGSNTAADTFRSRVNYGESEDDGGHVDLLSAADASTQHYPSKSYRSRIYRASAGHVPGLRAYRGSR
jgi:hypothetical protein